MNPISFRAVLRTPVVIAALIAVISLIVHAVLPSWAPAGDRLGMEERVEDFVSRALPRRPAPGALDRGRRVGPLADLGHAHARRAGDPHGGARQPMVGAGDAGSRGRLHLVGVRELAIAKRPHLLSAHTRREYGDRSRTAGTK